MLAEIYKNSLSSSSIFCVDRFELFFLIFAFLLHLSSLSINFQKITLVFLGVFECPLDFDISFYNGVNLQPRKIPHFIVPTLENINSMMQNPPPPPFSIHLATFVCIGGGIFLREMCALHYHFDKIPTPGIRKNVMFPIGCKV